MDFIRKILIRRTDIPGKRLITAALQWGEMFLNYSDSDPGLYYKLNSSPSPRLYKVGNAHVGVNPPNFNPQEGSVVGPTQGEFWYCTDPESPFFENLLIYVNGEWKVSVSFVEQIP